MLLIRGGHRWGFEVKYADAPRTTRSMRVAIADLHLDRLFVIYPGERGYELDDRISVRPVAGVGKIAPMLNGPA